MAAILTYDVVRHATPQAAQSGVPTGVSLLTTVATEHGAGQLAAMLRANAPTGVSVEVELHATACAARARTDDVATRKAGGRHAPSCRCAQTYGE